MKENGLVVDIQGNTAKVKFKRTSACGKCSACGILKDMSEIVVDVPNTLNVDNGARVEVEFNVETSLKSAVIVYVLPLIMLLLGVFLGYIIGSNVELGISADVLGALMGIVFVVIAMFILKAIDKKLKPRMANIYAMVRIIN